MAKDVQADVAVSTGWDEQAASEALQIDSMTDELSLPWTIASALVRHDREKIGMVLDIAAGPGGFLATALVAFPDANGVWFDFSQAMLEKAQAKLTAFSGASSFESATCSI